MLLQIVLGGLGGLAVASRLGWLRIRDLLPFWRGPAGTVEDETGSPAEEETVQTPESYRRAA
jgi:hypothetical protein